MANIEEIYISPTKFPDELCDRVIEEFFYAQKTHPSYIINSGEQFSPLERKDKVVYLDDYELQSEFSGVMATKVNKYLNIALVEYFSKFELLKIMNLRSVRQKVQETDIGGGYHIWHCEQGNLDTQSRVLTWTIYLNDVEEGGETEFLYQHKRVKAKKGDILIFPASFTHTHRGNPPISNKKYIVTGWYNLF
tara:strand:- start:337 stop:912 length:576 start_codon:yes stop_codon:yes gene_type:complete